MSPVSSSLPYQDAALPYPERARDLVSRLTLAEKITQLLSNTVAVERLGMPAHHWWNECLHGVARAGVATVFPQAIGMAASWDPMLHHRIAAAISDEARAKHHEAARAGQRGQYQGLTYWSPNINLFRDPRWGRGQETYGEDPFLTSRLGVAFIRGLQGDHPRYLKLVATAKHYAVHSGPEGTRHSFDSRATERDLRESYLPHFQAAVKEARVASVMGAYNRFNGEPCCSSDRLLNRILREEWGFEGVVVSDCGAIDDIFLGHKVVPTPEEAAARAVKGGCDLECGGIYRHLAKAVEKKLITEEEIDRALERVVVARMRLGVFDAEDENPYAKIPATVVDSAEHRALALASSRKSLVLLQNEGGFLPLGDRPRRIAVIGPNADSLDVLLGNYNGTPSKHTTLLAGIRAGAPAGSEVQFAKGCEVVGAARDGIAEAVALAKGSDLAVLVLGLSPRFEGEEGDATLASGSGDRADLFLPGVQEELLHAVAAAGKPVVLVLTGGSAIALRKPESAAAILMAWYPGQDGGEAVADVLFGRVNPSGRLPVTFYRSAEDLPPLEDYSMAGRTYRFCSKPVWRPFGFGLSYTRFRYDNLRLPAQIQAGQSLRVEVEVENVGARDGEEVVQVYVRHAGASVPAPLRTLGGFTRLALRRGERKTAWIEVRPQEMALTDESGDRFIEPGMLLVAVGGGQPGPDFSYPDEAGASAAVMVTGSRFDLR